MERGKKTKRETGKAVLIAVLILAAVLFGAARTPRTFPEALEVALVSES